MTRNLREEIPLGAVIAERELLFERAGQTSYPIRVQVGAPVTDPKQSDAALCPIRVSGFEKEEELVLGGVDTVQALVLALHSLAPFLSLCAHQRDGSLTWLGHSDLGFPERTE